MKNIFCITTEKDFFSINAMVVCDNKMRIRSIDARYPGCNHDSHIWGLSKLRFYMERRYRKGERNTWLLGHAGYPLEPWLMTPYRSVSEGTQQSNYNMRHSRTRNIVSSIVSDACWVHGNCITHRKKSVK
ncbi:PREDICTED: putative nuclease HARBI1 [Rhagoletis zephyria]|uniref:putative nuclease HARBI1 n=1 Tax=Rhagoletis zephyria TaxID=28612 RepID=UPI0008112896|nr:PREDICTED: putative nuclease HARBI1 [Rhagoletis zephyria]XP_017467536.1 PREDICTED: putative nuclease HARBI1 [Rhagoletis zephyria]